MVVFVGVELVIFVICILISKNIIDNRRGLAKCFVFGKDDEDVVKKMKKIVRDIVSTGKLQIYNTLDGYNVKINTHSGLIEVETARTRLIYKLANHEEFIYNKAWSKKGAIVFLALALWGFSFGFQLMLGMIFTILPV